MDSLVEIANKSFTLFRCSPLYSFEKKNNSNKGNLRSLTLYLCSELQLSISGKMQKENARGEIKDVRFESMSLPEIRSYDGNVKPLKVTVQLRFTRDKADTNHVFIFLPAVEFSNESSDFTYYSLMLAKAKNIVTSEVIDWLKKSFACNISPLFIPTYTFHKMLRLWVPTLFELAPLEDEILIAPDRAIQHSLELVYNIHSLKELSSINVKLRISEVIKISKKLKYKQDFIFAMQDHLFKTTKINVGSLPIGKLTTSNMALDKEGRFKIFGDTSRTEASKIISELIDLSSTK